MRLRVIRLRQRHEMTKRGERLSERDAWFAEGPTGQEVCAWRRREKF